MVIQEVIDQWLASEKGQCDESTHQTYRYTLSVFQTFLAQRQPAITAVQEVTLPVLQAYIRYLHDTRRLADRTLHTYVHVVARWLTDLINDGELVIQSERGNILTPEGVRKRLQRKLPSLEPPVAPRTSPATAPTSICCATKPCWTCCLRRAAASKKSWT